MRDNAAMRKPITLLRRVRRMALLLALLAAVGAMARLALPGLLCAAANHFMPRLLHAPFSLQGLGLELLAGRVELAGLRVGQPPGFGPGFSIAADRACVEIDLKSLRRPPVRFRNLVLDGCGFRLAAGPLGRFNTSALFGQAAPGGADIADAGPAVFPVFIVERATVTNGFFAYADYSDPARPSEARSRGLHGTVTNLVIAPESERGLWGRGHVRLAGLVAQAPQPDAALEADCEIEAFGDYIPRISGMVRADGLKLAALEGVFGLDLSEAVRDDPVAFHADADLSPEAIQGCASLDAGAGMTPWSVGLARWEWDTGAGLIRDLRIMQPADYGSGMMATVSEIRVRMGTAKAGDAWTRIEELCVNGLAASLLTDADGRLNAATWLAESSDEDPAGEARPPEGGLLFGLVAFSNAAVTLSAMDDAAGGPPDMRFDAIALNGTNLAFGAEPRPPGSGGGWFTMNVWIADSAAMPLRVRIDSGAGLGRGPLLWVEAEIPCLDLSAMEPWVPLGFLEAVSGTEAEMTVSGRLDRNGIDAKAVVRNAADEPVLVADRLRCGWGFDVFDAGSMRVRHPAGCGEGWMLSAEKAQMRLKRADTPGGPARISLLEIENAEANLLLMEDGSLNVEALAVPGPGSDLAAQAAGPEAADGGGLLFEAIELRNIALNLRETKRDGLDLRVERMSGHVSALLIGEHAGTLPGRIQAAGELRQPGQAPARFQADARMGTVAGGVPPIKAALSLRDFKPAAFLPGSRANVLPALFRESLSIDGHAAIGGTVVEGAFTMQTSGGDTLIALDRVLLDWSRGDMVLKNLSMAHAKSFGSELLLVVPEASVRVESGSLFDPPAVVEYATVRGADLRLIRDAHGFFNSEGWMPRGAPAPDAQASPSVAASAPVLVRRLELEDGRFSYADCSGARAPVLLRMGGICALATNLIFADTPESGVAAPGGGMLHARLEQRPYPDALFGLSARFGALGAGIPCADADAVLLDLELDAFAALVPEPALRAIGGAPVALEGSFSHAADSIGIGLRAGLMGGRDLVALERMEIELDRREPTGRMNLRNLSVFQPEGFGGGRLLHVPSAEMFCAPASLLSPPTDIRYCLVERPELNIVIHSNGTANTSALLFQGGPGRESGPPEALPGERVESASPVMVREFKVSGGALRLRDEMPDGPPLDLAFTNIIVEVDSLLLNAERLDAAPPGNLRATARLCQSGQSDAFVGACARTAPVVRNRPAFNVSARIGDLELKTIQAVLPAGAAVLIGGEALDISADLRVAPDALDGRISSEIIGGNSLPLLKIGGTPLAPRMDRSHILFSLGARLGGQVGGAFKKTFHLGTDLGHAAYDTTFELRQGAGNIVWNAGDGLWNAMVGAAGADAGGVAGGLVEATAGTITTTFSTARRAGGRILDGVMGAAAINQRAAEQWRSETPARWARKWDEAARLVESAPLAGER